MRMDLPLLSAEELLSLKPVEQAAYAKALKRQQQTRTTLDLAEAINPITKRFPHVELLDHHLTALCEGRLYHDGPGPIPVEEDGVFSHPDDWHLPLKHRRKPVYKLAIAMPPRHGKSYMVSEHLPVWFLNKWPDWKVMLASYSDDKAEEWGGKARDHMVTGHEAGILDVTVKGGEGAAQGSWQVEGHRGGMLSKGTGGRLTGDGGHLMIIDDPIKGEEDAQSPRMRDKLEGWYDSVWDTRREMVTFAHGATTMSMEVMMFTRWNEDDIAGRKVYLPDSDIVRDDWCLLSLPALAGEDDVLGRESGEALCPQLVSQDFLLSKQKDSPTWFAAMYQGRPVVEGGGILAGPYATFESFDEYLLLDDGHKVAKDELVYFAVMDTAFTKNTWSDYTVYTVWGMDRQKRLFLMMRERTRILGPEHKVYFRAWWDAWPVRFVGIEDSGSGKQLLQELTADEEMSDIKALPLQADSNKVARAIPYGIDIRERRVFFPADAVWLAVWLNEHGKFPNGAHDDQVDTGAYARQMVKMHQVTADPEKEPETPSEKAWKYIEEKHHRQRRDDSAWSLLE